MNTILLQLTNPEHPHRTIDRVRKIAAAAKSGGPFRAPHWTIDEKGLRDELRLARRGVLMLDDVSDFQGSVLARVFREWTASDPAERPVLVCVLRTYEDATYQFETYGDLRRWVTAMPPVDEHLVVGGAS